MSCFIYICEIYGILVSRQKFSKEGWSLEIQDPVIGYFHIYSCSTAFADSGCLYGNRHIYG